LRLDSPVPTFPLLFTRRCRPVRFPGHFRLPTWCSPNPFGRAACRQDYQFLAHPLRDVGWFLTAWLSVRVALSDNLFVSPCHLGASLAGRPVGHSSTLGRSPLRVAHLAAAITLAHPLRDGQSATVTLSSNPSCETSAYRRHYQLLAHPLRDVGWLPDSSVFRPGDPLGQPFRQPLYLDASLAGRPVGHSSTLGRSPLRVAHLTAAITLAHPLRDYQSATVPLPANPSCEKSAYRRDYQRLAHPLRDVDRFLIAWLFIEAILSDNPSVSRCTLTHPLRDGQSATTPLSASLPYGWPAYRRPSPW